MSPILGKSQIDDSIYSVPIGTDRVDTIRLDSTKAIKLIEYISHDKVLKRLFYSPNGNLYAVEYYDEIGRIQWTITWYPDGKLRSTFYKNYQFGSSWYEDGKEDEIAICSNDTIIRTYHYESGKTRKIIKELAGYDSTHYRYSITFCENGQKTSEEFSGRIYTYHSYYCDGKKRVTCRRDAKGRFIGKYISWNENGTVGVKGHFANSKQIHNTSLQGEGFGQKEGKWNFYDKNGKLTKVDIYKAGTLLYTKLSDGTIIRPVPAQ